MHLFVFCHSCIIYIVVLWTILLEINYSILFYINYLKYTNNILAKFFHYLLFYMKPDNISLIIYTFYIPSITELFIIRVKQSIFQTIFFHSKSRYCQRKISPKSLIIHTACQEIIEF